ncbi:MAG: GNAT family N-acetyltransferase [Phaeovulum sp.]|uniref:GNAT family N-acetyltransferase n=1 Tax=Phaeovulum sp. TaxID=2934796 RepID=UPI00272F3330|nr:GNAT family N-acetyltransferase [Phaeovulum sp.]MDP2062240.1 GNAT family N-acetyltransferase [Phaeovulum sp.]
MPEAELFPSVSEIPEADWDICACPETVDGARPYDPFTTHRFLALLEASGSVGPGTGWQPRPLVLRDAGQVIAVAPTYVKSHSQGEYIFDHGWAEALERAGGRYYPKLQVAVPFTPVTGRRLLARSGHEAAGRIGLLEALRALAANSGLSSAHLTFCTAEESDLGVAAGYLPRVTTQYHWHNRGYTRYSDFLDDLSSRKRKALRRERAEAQAFGGEMVALTGAEIMPEHWAAMWDFYQHTGERKWGRPYLSRAFFEAAMALNRDVLLVLARREGRWVAGALNFIGREALFGRYWGAIEVHPSLHFELCYHQAIDWAIAHGLARVEAGAQGEHKLARGYLPAAVHSLHWIADPAFRRAVANYLAQEREDAAHEIAELSAQGPFRRDDGSN